MIDDIPKHLHKCFYCEFPENQFRGLACTVGKCAEAKEYLVQMGIPVDTVLVRLTAENKCHLFCASKDCLLEMEEEMQTEAERNGVVPGVDCPGAHSGRAFPWKE